MFQLFAILVSEANSPLNLLDKIQIIRASGKKYSTLSATSGNAAVLAAMLSTCKGQKQRRGGLLWGGSGRGDAGWPAAGCPSV